MRQPNPLKEVNDCIEWVLLNHPDCIKFNPDNSARKSIAVYLEYNKPDTYGTMTMMYGILFTLAVLEYYVFIENYEKCAVLLTSIKQMNDLYGCELPTSLYTKWVLENIDLKPSEILAKHFHKTHTP